MKLSGVIVFAIWSFGCATIAHASAVSPVNLTLRSARFSPPGGHVAVKSLPVAHTPAASFSTKAKLNRFIVRRHGTGASPTAGATATRLAAAPVIGR